MDELPMSACVSASNSPCEDCHNVRKVEIGGTPVQVYSVFDGHGSTFAVALAAERLPDMILSRFGTVGVDLREAAEIVKMISECFEAVDELILTEALSQHSGTSTARRSGCCALVLVIVHDTMYFAHVGDCRAVLVRSKVPDSPSIDSEIVPSASPVRREIESSGSGFTVRDLYLEHLLNTFSTMTTKKRKVAPPDLGGEGFVFTTVADSSEVIGITTDHACTNPIEVLAVKHISSDPSPIRSSEKDKGVKHAPKRVAGSLLVTRALGDGYLKRSCLSDSHYSRFLPYITCKPTITYKKIDASVDMHIVLASDGLWNYMSAHDIHAVVKRFTSPIDSTFSGPLAQALVDKCIDQAKIYCGKSSAEFDSLAPGADRREVIDDITVLVLSLQPT